MGFIVDSPTPGLLLLPRALAPRDSAATLGISRSVQPISNSLRRPREPTAPGPTLTQPPQENLHWGSYLSPGGPCPPFMGLCTEHFPRRGSLPLQGGQARFAGPINPAGFGTELWVRPRGAVPAGNEPASVPPLARPLASLRLKGRTPPTADKERSSGKNPAGNGPQSSRRGRLPPRRTPTRGERRSARLPPAWQGHRRDGAGCHEEHRAAERGCGGASRVPWMPVWWDMSHRARAPPPPPPRPPHTARPGPAART